MTKGKYTRKQLRQPDEFISLSMRVWEFVRERASRVAVAIGAAVLVAGSVATWSHFAEKRAAANTQELSRGIEILNQMVVAGADIKPPESENEVPRFKTEPEKIAAAEKEFSAAIDKAGGSLGAIARLLRGSVEYKQGNYRKAIEDYRAFVDSGPTEPFRTIAIENAGYALEEQKKYADALEQYRKLSDEGETKWLKKYHEGRILALTGTRAEAVAALKEVVEKTKDRSLKDRASIELAATEAKSS